MNKPNLQELLQDKQTITRLMQSPQAKALAQMLSRSDTSELKHAAQQAAKGDTAQLAKLMEQLSSQPESSQLLKQLEQTMGK